MKYKSQIVTAFFRECGLPMPLLEHKFHPTRKWRFDFAFIIPSERAFVALEVDGGIWIGGGHNRGAQMKKDWEKRNAAAVLGWRILYVEPRDLCTVATANLVKECLAQ